MATNKVIVVWFDKDSWDKEAIESFFETRYPGTIVQHMELYDPGTGGQPSPEVVTIAYPTTHMPPVITSAYNEQRVGYVHKGLDLRSSYAAWGDIILNGMYGVVTAARYDSSYGNHVIVTTFLKGGEKVDIRYAHFTDGSTKVSVGETVIVGQPLGHAGTTGASTGDHLHIDVRVDGIYVDPTPLIIWPGTQTNTYTRGAHAAPTTAQTESTTDLLEKLKSMRLKWYKILDNGAASNVSLAAALLSEGIVPVVRLYREHQFPFRISNITRASAFINVGVEYFEIGNEPNLPGEWRIEYQPIVDYNNEDLVSTVALNWMEDAEAIMALGGKPALYAMAPTNRNANNTRFSSYMWTKGIVDRMPRAYADYFSSGKIWLATHSATFGKPFDQSPYQGTYIDDMCLLSYTLYQDLISKHLSIPVQTIRTISTEGGVYSPAHMQYIGWGQPYTDFQWANMLVEMYDYLDSRKDILGMCTWTMSDYDVADPRWLGSGWWDRNNNPTIAVNAMKEP